MNPIRTIRQAARSVRMGWNAARLAYRRNARGLVSNRYEAGRRWQWGERSYIWSWVTDARFDANQADRWEILRKARYFEANSPLVQRLADIWEQYTVGPNGLVITPASQDEEWTENARLWFDNWSREPDLCSRQSLSSLQGLSSRLWMVEGEIFILKTRTQQAPYRPRIQLIESHRVGTPGNMQKAEGSEIVDGVEIDSKGKPLAYWVKDDFDDKTHRRISADNIIHVMEPPRVGLYRGLSHFYAVMNALHDLDDLQKLEMGAAKEAAGTTKVVKTDSGELPEDPNGYDEVNTAAAGPNVAPTENPFTTFYERKFGPEVKVMFKGDEYEQFVSNRPSVAQQWYWKFLTEEICSGVGIPLVMVFPDSMQGTVYRGAIDGAAMFFRSRSSILAAAWLDVWRYVMDFATKIDVTVANRPDDWAQARVRPPRSANVDVGRNSAAMLAELEAGTRTYADVYGELGQDWRDQLQQRALEAKYIRQLEDETGGPFITMPAEPQTPKPEAVPITTAPPRAFLARNSL